MSYISTGTNSAGVLSLKRDSAVAAVKKAAELMRDGARDVHITAPDAASTVMSNLLNSIRPRGRNARRPVVLPDRTFATLSLMINLEISKWLAAL
jgi:hypothetical protein